MKSISPKNQEEDNKSVNIIGKALAEKNGNKWDKTTQYLRESLQEKRKTVVGLIKKLEGKTQLDKEAEIEKMNERIDSYDKANTVLTDVINTRPKTRFELRKTLDKGVQKTLKAIHKCIFEEKFEDMTDPKMNKPQLLNVITDELVARDFKYCVWCKMTVSADESESSYEEIIKNQIKCGICRDYICSKCSLGEKDKIKEIMDSKMVTISCGTCKEGIDSIAKYMMESNTSSMEVYPDAFKEIKKFREGESLTPYKYQKKQAKNPKNTRNQNLLKDTEEEMEESSNSSQEAIAVDSSIIKELITQLEEMRTEMKKNQTQKEDTRKPTGGGARPKTGESWAPKDLQEDLVGVGITSTIMESLKKAIIELSDTTKEHKKEEKEKIGKEAVEQITQINDRLTSKHDKNTAQNQQYRITLDDINEESENDSSFDTSELITSTQANTEANLSPPPQMP